MSDLTYIKSEVVKFTSKIGNKEISIHYRLFKDGTAYLEYFHFEPEYIKMFINLMSNSIDSLLEKKYNYFVQKVATEDWENFLKQNKDWELINKDIINDTVDIRCTMDKALVNICKGLGLD